MRGRDPAATKEKLLDAAQALFRLRGYAETTVDDICDRAGTTKGAFFHHFEGKDDVALSALDRFTARRLSVVNESLGSAVDPVERLFAHVEQVIAVSSGRKRPAGCLLGIFALELGLLRGEYRAACKRYLGTWQRAVAAMIQDALRATGRDSGPSARDLAAYFISVFEGSMIVFRATGDRGIYARNLGLFRDHLRLLLAPEAPARGRAKRVRS